MIDLIVQTTAHASSNAVTVLAEGLAAGIAGAAAAAALIMHGLHAATPAVGALLHLL
jgi:hypothetical protein